MTAFHEAATNALALASERSQTGLQTSERSGLPAWADAAILSGEPNTYFDAKDQARKLSTAQREGLASLIKDVSGRMRGPEAEARAHMAEALVKIACRVQPGISDTAGLEWAAEMVKSLSRTPMDLLLKAIEAARYRQFQFLNEVGPFLAAEIDEPLRQRNIKLNRLKQIELAANALPAPSAGYATPEQAAEIMAQFKIHERAKKASKPEASAPIDWDVETAKRCADSNFLRAVHGLPTRTVEEYKRDQAKAIRDLRGLPDEQGGDGVDPFDFGHAPVPSSRQ